jgi:hypothetical protein
MAALVCLWPLAILWFLAYFGITIALVWLGDGRAAYFCCGVLPLLFATAVFVYFLVITLPSRLLARI